MAIASGVEEALRGPPGGGVWGKVAPPGVANKVGLARRWLALHVQLFSQAVKLRPPSPPDGESTCSEGEESSRKLVESEMDVGK